MTFEPVVLLDMSVLQYLAGLPDRQAVEMWRYQVGWNLARKRQLGDHLFQPAPRVNFRQRRRAHGLSVVGFQFMLKALATVGLVSRTSGNSWIRPGCSAESAA